ncbi:deoxyguanosinetriphosphate triphosphohydrolase family protein [Desulfocicer niacini]
MNELTGFMKQGLDQREHDQRSPLSAFSDNATRRHADTHQTPDYRQSFCVDADRILNSLAYTRYIDKTQVFSLIKNDHLSHRVLHVQLVSRIARTIGRYLGLNEDLIEAISMGHDIGHPPFGHDGERILSRLTQKHGIGFFHHNVQSVQFLEKIERHGRGWDLTLETLDAILCHNGEVHCRQIKPLRNKTFDDFDATVKWMKTMEKPDQMPMTSEGCVVRMADTIAYIGRDFEDAIRLGLVIREDLPSITASRLGSTNGTIVFNLVTDLISSSMQSPQVGFSEPIFEALLAFKEFNYRCIYKNPLIKNHLKAVENIYEYLFEMFLTDLEKNKLNSMVFTRFLRGISQEYRQTHTPPEIVRDFISGMTDSFFISQAPESMRPRHMEMPIHV